MSEEKVDATTENAEEEVLETSTDEVDEKQAELDKANELANNYKIRAEKAERLAKSLKEKVEKPEPKEEPEAKTSTAGDLSSRDLFALMNAKVSEEDIDEVKEYAQLKKISISEALKTLTVKTILSEKAEQRKTANAANTGGSKRGSGKVTDELLLSNAKKGVLPEDDEEIQRLYKLRKGIK